MIGARILLVVLSLFFLIFNAGANGLDPRALSIDDIPTCGITCLFLTVPQSGCSLSDIQCQCQNEDLAHSLSACLLANCTMADSLGTAVVQADLCNLSNESRTREVVLYTAIVFSIAIIFVALRLTGKIMAKRITPDDYILIAAMLLTAVPVGCVLTMTYMGFGEHLWNLQPGQLKQCLLFFFVSWSTYVIVLGLIKVSLIMFYLQIFITREFRIVAYVVMTYIVLSTLVIFFITIFSCYPVNSFWDRDIKGKCININAIAYANSGSAIAQDIIILILPMVSVSKLKTNKYRKIAIGVMFAFGTFGCITTILRLHSLFDFKISIDPTWDYVSVTIWTELELASGFVCVSLPAIRILITMIFPGNLLSSITSRKSKSGSIPRNNPTPDRERSGKKGFSWRHIPSLHDDEGTGLQEMKGSIWSSANQGANRSPTLATFRSTDFDMDRRSSGVHGVLCAHKASGSQKPLRAHPTSPTIMFEGYLRDSGVVKSPASVVDRTQFCNSCGSQGPYITALPKLGCLPDGSYSGELDKGRKHAHHLHPPRT